MHRRKPAFAGIFQMDRYRDLQTEWLAEAVESPAVKTAKFKVAMCHIPLFHPNWRDLNLPVGDGPKKGKCAAMTRPCARRWRPFLDKAGIKLVVSGHTHRFVCYEPSADCPWTQITGGGCAVRATLAPDGKGIRYFCLLNQPACNNNKLLYNNAVDYMAIMPGTVPTGRP